MVYQTLMQAHCQCSKAGNCVRRKCNCHLSHAHSRCNDKLHSGIFVSLFWQCLPPRLQLMLGKQVLPVSDSKLTSCCCRVSGPPRS